MKSNVSATRMSRTTIGSMSAGALPVFHDDALDDVGDVLAAIGGLLEEIERFLPLDDDDRIAFLVEQPDDRLLMDAVGFVLEPIDFDAVRPNAFDLLER